MSAPLSDLEREYLRVFLHEPALLTAINTGEVVCLLDISSTGAKLRLSVQSNDKPRTPGLKIGQRITLKWRPVEGLPEMVFESTLVWKKSDQCGIRFENISAKQRAIVGAMLRFHLGPELSST